MMLHDRSQGIVWMASFLFIVGMNIAFVAAGDFALVADLHNGSIYAGRMSLGLADFSRLPLSGLERPVAVDYDPVEKMIYWSDLDTLPNAKISRAHLNGSNQVTFVDNLRFPYGLALDLEARILYWTDSSIGQIGRTTMDGRGAKEIIIHNLDKPINIVTDTTHGYIYWADWGDNPHIERARLDGSGREIIVEGSLVSPYGVQIDSARNYLFWCDANLDKIERSDLLGNGRMLLVNLTGYDEIKPFDLAIYEDNVYWTDWGYVHILRVHESGRGVQGYGPNIFQLAGGIHIQEEPDYCDSHPCHNGGSCEDVINGFSCLCTSGFHGLTCESPNDPCDNQPCWNGGVCISASSSFTCRCPAGFQGLTCATNVCSSRPCFNGGTCTGTSSGFACQCSIGYQGPTCADDLCASQPCLNGGTCFSSLSGFTCVCPVGYQGPICSDDVCSSRSCLNGGTCTGTSSGFACQCSTGYQGPTCADDICGSRPCLNGGSCLGSRGGFTCSCAAGYGGSICSVVNHCVLPLDPSGLLLVVSGEETVYIPGTSVEYDCPNGYQLNGSAMRTCLSDFTWSGQPPECIMIELCQSKPCMNGGTCTTTPGGFSCRCPAGYDGPICATRRRGCSAPPQPVHAVLVQSGVTFFEPGDEANFICDQGYFISDSGDHSVLRVCRSDGTWSGEKVQCYSKPDKGSPVPVGAIAGGAGGVFLIILILFAVLVYIKRQKKRGDNERVIPAITTVSGHGQEQPPPYRNPTYEDVINDYNIPVAYCGQLPSHAAPFQPTDDAQLKPRIYMEILN